MSLTFAKPRLVTPASWRDRLRDWGVWAIGAAALWVLAYGVWIFAPFGPPALQVVVGDLADLPVAAAAAVLAWRASRLPTLPKRVQRGWRWLAAAYALLLVAHGTYAALELVAKVDPFPSIADVLFLSFYPIALQGLLCFAGRPASRAEGLKRLLDIGTTLVGAGAFLSYFLIFPAATEQGRDVGHALVAAAYPVGDLVLLLGILSILFQGELGGSSRPLRVLAFGLLVLLAADLGFAYLNVRKSYQATHVTDALWNLSYLIVMVAAQVQRGVVVVPEPQAPRRLRAVDLVPYLSVLGVLALLVVASARHYATPLGVVVFAVIALVALAVTRQIVTARDNERLLRAQAARASEARFAALVEKSSDVICILDAEGCIAFVSPSLGKVLGHRPEGLAGHPFLELVHPDDQDLGRAYLSDLELRQGATTPLAWRLRHADGRYLHIETVGTNLKDDPQVQGVVLNSRDITERTQLEQRLTHLAFHDPLTQLANRALFHDRLAHALARLSLRPERKLAVMIVDLDNFKTINDSLGHGEGDRLLVEAAARLRARVRSGDTVARLGGDEFGVLLEDIEDSEIVHATARSVVEAFKEPFALDGHEAVVSVSVGVAHAAARETADDVLRNADLTLYVAKGRGKARIEVFEQEMHAAVLRRLQLETDLRQALERDELYLLYQPVIDLRTGRIKGVEALMRWAHPSQGTLSPTLFIPVAEETGLIVPLGRVALRKACAQARRWQDELRLDRPLSMAVNLSGKQLIEGSIVGDVADALDESGLPSEQLVLEITESVMMGDAPEVTRRLEELRALGVRIAIDDFGTGYSSLATLDRFPVDVLKIDRSFVSRVDGPGDGAALARAVLSVGTALGLETVAEGIERPEQLAALRGLGCELGQGFLFARPEPPEAILARCRALATTTPGGEGGRGGRRVGTGTSPGRRREDGE